MTATHFRCDMAITVMRGSAGQRYRFPFASHHGLVVERYVCRLGGRRVTFIRG